MASHSIVLVTIAIFASGFCIVGGQIASNALTATFYPTAIRSTGVGWALGIGRIGSILGPLIGGLMLARDMRLRGRIIQCGTAANASWTPVPTGPRPEREILTRRLRWSGFIIFDHLAEFDAAAARLAELALAGQIVHDEEVLPGLEHAPGAIARLYRGENQGKLIIAVD